MCHHRLLGLIRQKKIYCESKKRRIVCQSFGLHIRNGELH
jgi:hypothetical protein